MNRALILGINGQDGSYLADLLLAQGYEVHGMVRRTSLGNLQRISHVAGRITLHYGDMADPLSVERVISTCEPDEIYNEADQDSVGWSHVTPSYQMDITAAAVVRTLESVRTINPDIRFFQPCSAMMFGDPVSYRAGIPQNELTPFNPQSPYAVAKVAAYYAARHYREQHGMHVSTGILFNHDSPRRTEDYLLHKICNAAVRIAAGKQNKLLLGNLDGRVDIGFAGDYMRAATLMLRMDAPGDYVVATGTALKVGDMVAYAFSRAGVEGEPLTCIGVDERFWKPGAPSYMCGDASKVRNELGWIPERSIYDVMDMLIEDARAKL